MEWRIYRDIDSKAFRKVIIELWGPHNIVDRCRMFGLFGGRWFSYRLHKKQRRMLNRAQVMLAAQSLSEYDLA